MKAKHLRFGKGFRVMLSNQYSQAAQMTLVAGQTEGGPANRHRGADQWLYVVSGRGHAVVNGKTYQLEAGTLLMIERGDRHEIRNSAKSPLRTLSVYVPPAYTLNGEELPAGRKE
jgi:mannose-6-phosphate isomerase-like protein (cupin superfamily)